MNKKKLVSLVLGGTLIAAIAFNAGTTAKYVQKLETATQTITTATFNIESISELKGSDNFKPGDTIEEDKITLKNNDSYPVAFNITLNNDQDNDLWEFLELSVEGIESEESESDNIYKVILNSGETKEVFSKIAWKNKDIEASKIAGKSITIEYAIDAEQVIEEVVEN